MRTYYLGIKHCLKRTPDKSLISKDPKNGLIVLRSVGKFFGLAGIRLGFVWTETEILQELADLQDDWSVSHPTRWVGKKALENRTWQQKQRAILPTLSKRLVSLLEPFILAYDKEKTVKSRGVSFKHSSQVLVSSVIHSTSLFAYFEHKDSQFIHEGLASKGILTRLFFKTDNQNNAIRFGLAANEQQWKRLQQALETILNSVGHE